MRLRTPLIALTLLLALVGAACSGDDADATTTTTTVAEVPENGTGNGEVPPPGENGNGDNGDNGAEDTTTTTVDLGAAGIPEFEIVTREPASDGDTVVVLLDPESYSSLTDIDLQNVIAEVVDEFPPVYEMHVVDSADVVEYVLVPRGDLTTDQQNLLDIHYLVRLEENFRIVFQGPFAETPTSILGS